MMIHGLTSSDLVAAYIERFHPGMHIMVVYLHNGCKNCQVLDDIKQYLSLQVPDRMELDSDYIFIGSHREELAEFILTHPYNKCRTRLELYVDNCLYMTN